VRIKGLVAASNQVREQLKVGIAAEGVEAFRQQVRATLRATEQLCASARMMPAQLPTPSRKAYAFLKQLDLKHLPIADSSLPTATTQFIALRNVRAQQEQIQSEIAAVAGHTMGTRRSPFNPAKIEPLRRLLQQKVTEIEQICSQNELSPAQLTGNSKSHFAWMKYLLEEQHLLSHVEAVQRLQQIISALDQPHATKGFGKAKTQPPAVKPVRIELTNMQALYRFRNTDKIIQMQMSEGFIAAEDEVFKALAYVVRSGKSPETNEIIARFSCSEEFSEILLAMDLLVGDIADAAQGHAYNLEDIFSAVNRSHFNGQMAKPQLAWSKTFTQRKYGHYEPSRDRVVLSRTLDDLNIPRYVAEFVMYHELLHKQHGEVWMNGRQRVHTPAFRRDERQFKQYDLAEAFLNKLAAAR
jgi:hypothetical protein